MKAVSTVVRPSVAFVVLIALLIGCARVQPIYEVHDRSVPSSLGALGFTEVEKRLIDAAAATQWQAVPVRPGLLRATTSWRRHSAVVNIEYNSNSYSIRHVSSSNLREGVGHQDSLYSGQKVIHRNYNRRVKQLELEIERRLYSPAS